MPSLVLADWDNTFRHDFSAEAWLQFLAEEGLVTAAHVEEYRRLVTRLRRGQLEYESFLGEAARLYGEAISGLNEASLGPTAQAFVEVDRQNLYPHSAPLLQALNDLGARVVLISGGPEVVLRAYAQVLPIAESIGLSVSNARSPWPGTAAFKEAARQRVMTKPQVALGVGDSPSDRPLLEPARLRIVVDNQPLASEYPDSFGLATSDPNQVAELVSWVKTEW